MKATARVNLEALRMLQLLSYRVGVGFSLKTFTLMKKLQVDRKAYRVFVEKR